MLLKNQLDVQLCLRLHNYMIVKITRSIQDLVKILIVIIAFSLQPQSLVFAQPAIDAEDISIPTTVKKIRVQGYTIFEHQEIEKIIKPFRGKELDFRQLRNLTKAITDLYVSEGYITSGAFLPEQEIVDGIINVRVVEGKLEKLDIKGLKHLQENYIRSFISSAKNSSISDTDSGNISSSDSAHSPPLNIKKIEEELDLLKRDPSIEKIDAELVRGTQPNLSVLLIKIEETSPFDVKFSFDNYRSPSIGEFQGTLSTGYRNLIGVSDRAFAQYNLTEGFNAYSLGYKIPLNAKNGTVSVEYRNGDSKIIEDFEEVNIRAKADTISLQYRQPIIYQSARELALGITFERQNSETFILDNQPYSFTEDPQQTDSVVSVLKLTGDWVERSSSSVLGVSSELNFGLDAFDATVNENTPDGLFFSWLNQTQWTQALNQDRDLLLVTRLVTQLSPDSLLPLEQFTLGGVGTVRGYRQNRQVGDNAVVGTIEIDVPLIGDRLSSHKLNIVPFFDGGTVWDNNSDEAEALASLGLGLDWQFKKFLSLRVDWGVPLINTSDRGDSIQDNGFSFSLQLQPF
jgi:hemolysin activation/secretion protein